jgi:hypothetical protein
VLLVVVVLLGAIAVGYLAGGLLERLGELSLRRRWLLLLAGLAQLLGVVAGPPAYGMGLGLSALLAGGFVLVNRGVHGMGLVALGLGANALVVGVNGAMPVSADASGRAGVTTQSLLRGEDPRHELAGDDTRLRTLGDVVPVPLPWRPQVVSPGDLVIAAGLAELVVVGMTRGAGVAPLSEPTAKENAMAKRGRKRRARKKNAANHGKRPNA